jgi:alpha-ribazole phosphatase
MRLWLVRHARPDLAPGICYGAWDVPAVDDASQRTALALAKILPASATLEVSPLQRCTLLAQHLCAMRPDLVSRLNPDLVEMDFGQSEGHAWADIPHQDMQAWTDDFAHYRPGNGESTGALMVRVARAWDAVCARDGDTVWISHAGVIRAAHLLHQGVRQLTRADQWPLEGLDFGQWCTVELHIG